MIKKFISIFYFHNIFVFVIDVLIVAKAWGNAEFFIVIDKRVVKC